MLLRTSRTTRTSSEPIATTTSAPSSHRVLKPHQELRRTNKSSGHSKYTDERTLCTQWFSADKCFFMPCAPTNISDIIPSVPSAPKERSRTATASSEFSGEERSSHTPKAPRTKCTPSAPTAERSKCACARAGTPSGAAPHCSKEYFERSSHSKKSSGHATRNSEHTPGTPSAPTSALGTPSAPCTSGTPRTQATSTRAPTSTPTRIPSTQ